jgi:protein-serine/threonine kinase
MLVDQKAQDGDLGKRSSAIVHEAVLMSDLAPPTARPAPQSLRRLFHDENSADPDPFQSFAHQQPITPYTSQNGSVEQFAPNPEIDLDVQDSDEDDSFEGTVRQNKPKIRPSLGISQHSSDSTSAPSSHGFNVSNEYTPIALPQDDDSEDEDTNFEPPQAPFGQNQLRAKASYESLASNPTTRSQISVDSRPPASKDIRKPSGTAQDGLRGFQFPLSKAVMATRPAPLVRNASAAPFPTITDDGPSSSLSPTRPGMQRMQSAMPDLQSPTPSKTKPAKPQISINLPPRPPMMRHASAAVMEGRAQAQAQAQALAAVDEGVGRNLGVPAIGVGKGQIGLGVAIAGAGAGVGMSRSRSGSRTDDHGVGLRDLMRVSSLSSSLYSPCLTKQLSPAVPGLSDLPPSPSTTTQNPMLKHLQLPSQAQSQPSPLSLSYQSQPLQTSLSSNGPIPPYPRASSPNTSVPMAPSISQISTFSTGQGGLTVNHSPNPPYSESGITSGATIGAGSLNIRPLDMMTGHAEVYEELERRIDEMKGWLECVEVGLDDLLRSPIDTEESQRVPAL